MNFEGFISSLARLSAQASLLVVLILPRAACVQEPTFSPMALRIVAASCAEASSAGQS
jgi:hypothetical protein